jgi:methylated-DNA-[protein]-cysteine S-methyltransferase
LFAAPEGHVNACGRPGGTDMSWLQRRRWVAQTRCDTPLGPVTLAATALGLGGLWFDGQAHHPGDLDAPEQADQRWLAQARNELAAYWRGGHTARFNVPLDTGGTAFQQAVWQALCHIPAGATDRYGEIAARLGRPTAARAVGAAVGRNPISIIVPCHRVLGHGGALTGYAGGLDRKRDLLRREGAAF